MRWKGERKGIVKCKNLIVHIFNTLREFGKFEKKEKREF